ncbi:MAG: Tn7-like transposition protein [Anaerocolumna sp.]|jgi:hypothetical protein|nr:Tn7-like transposition protein [Anaerocolumna sp.]
MLNIMPAPYPDEILYSWFSRYHKMSGNTSPLTTINDLFGKIDENINVLFSSSLGYLAKQIPREWSYIPQDLINKFTIFPLYKPFLEIRDTSILLDNMINKNERSIEDYYISRAKSLFNKNHLKVCSKCYREDILNFGEAYLHRSHQVPGGTVCDKHMTYLTVFNVPCGIPHNVYIYINDYEVNFNNLECNNMRQIRISREINSLLSGILDEANLNLIKQKYDERLRTRGYKSPHGNVDQVKLLKDINKYYSNSDLKYFNSEIDANDNKNWVKSLTQDSGRYVHPIRHLLFIEFLYGGLEEFRQSDDSFKPFDNGPWMCLNPIAEHYGTKVIENCQIKKGKNDGSLIATFKCTCGFVYTKKQDQNGDILNQVCIKEFGTLWEKKLTEVVNTGVTNISTIANKMQCAPRTVLRYTEKLCLIHKINTSQRVLNQTKSNVGNESMFKQYKTVLDEYITDNPEESRSEIKKKFVKEYNYIFKYDRNWIEEVLPDAGAKRQSGIEKSWDIIDKELCKKIEDAIKLLLCSNKLIRITNYSISNIIGYSGIRSDKVLTKTPNTKQLLEDNTETILDFKKRKLDQLIKLMCQNNEIVTLASLCRKIWISKDECEYFKPYIRELTKKYKGD